MKKLFTLKAHAFISALFILAGLICAYLQRKHYGYIDENGILQDSLFIPLTMLFLIIGFLSSIMVVLRMFWFKA